MPSFAKKQKSKRKNTKELIPVKKNKKSRRENTKENFSDILFQKDMSSVIFSYLNMKDATQVRATCKEAKKLVSLYPWYDNTEDDSSQRIIDITKWKKCFPKAKSAWVHPKSLLGRKKEHFKYFEGIHTLNLWGCKNITDADLVHLRGIYELQLDHCKGITDEGFLALEGIHLLILHGSYTYTDILEYLQSIGTLIIYRS